MIATITFGCQKEILQSETSLPIAQFDGQSQIVRPDVQCGATITCTMKSSLGMIGNVEIMNSADLLYVVIDMNNFKFLDQIKVYVGDASFVRLDSDGYVDVEEFPYQYLFNSATNDYTFMLPVSELHSCQDIMVWASVSTRNMMGHVTNMTEAWMSGSPVSNGYATNYCLGSCFSGGPQVLARN